MPFSVLRDSDAERTQFRAGQVRKRINDGVTDMSVQTRWPGPHKQYLKVSMFL